VKVSTVVKSANSNLFALVLKQLKVVEIAQVLCPKLDRCKGDLPSRIEVKDQSVRIVDQIYEDALWENLNRSRHCYTGSGGRAAFLQATCAER